MGNVASLKPIVCRDDWAGVALWPQAQDATGTPITSPTSAATATLVVPGGAVRVNFIANGAGATVGVTDHDGAVALPSGVLISMDTGGMGDSGALFPASFLVTKNAATSVSFWFDMLEV